MREKLIKTVYSADGSYRYEIYKRPDDTFQIWVQKKIYDDYIEKNWFDWYDVKDCIHITDDYYKAIDIGDELLRMQSHVIEL